MRHMKLKWIVLFALSGACAPSKPLPSDTAALSTGTIRGVVRLLDGSPVSGVTVEVTDGSATTDDRGAFSLDDVAAGSRVSLLVRSDDISTGQVNLAVTAGRTTNATVEVLPLSHTTLDDAAQGGLVQTEDGLEIDFPPGVIVNEAGEAVSGPVDVATALLDEPEELAAAPGNLETPNEDGSMDLLISRGMVDVHLSQDGVALNVSEPVTVSYPLMSGVEPDDTSGDLYGFDEALGAWTLEGEGAVGEGRFAFQAPHFSYWNYDLKADYRGCVEGVLTLDGAALEGQEVGIWFTGGAHTNLTTGTTDGGDAGYVRSPAPAGETVSMLFKYTRATDDGGELTWYWSAGPVTIPDPDDGCYDLGELEPNGLDADGDEEALEPYGEDCDDGNPDVHPGAEEDYTDDVDEDCDGNLCDRDGDGACWDGYPYDVPDGYTADDCDDEDPSIGADPTWYQDEDGDGYGDVVVGSGCDAPTDVPSAVSEGGDCDDDELAVHPGATERCDDGTASDGLDNDCDGLIDLGCGSGEMVYEYGLAPDPTVRTCALYWDQTWAEIDESAETCPDCDWTVDVVSTLDAAGSTGVEECLGDETDFDWLLGYDADFYGTGEGRFWVSYYGAWYPTYLSASWDSATGALSWVHDEHSYLNEPVSDGAETDYYTDYWAGTATFAPLR